MNILLFIALVLVSVPFLETDGASSGTVNMGMTQGNNAGNFFIDWQYVIHRELT